MTQPPDWETRRDSRKPLQVEIRVQINPKMQETIHLAKESIPAELFDVSSHGMGMVSKIFLPPGVLVDLQIPKTPFLPQQEGIEEKPSREVIRVTGLVVYSKQRGTLCRMGISFTQIQEADRKVLEEFIQSTNRRRSPRSPL